MAPAICGDIVRSKRTLLALGWSMVNLLAFVSFLAALGVALFANNNSGNDQYYYQQEQNQEEEEDVEISVTSRAMAFTALWTMILSTLIGIYGTVVLGFVSFRGKYYWCCRNTVHKTTPMVLGAFMGSLLMYANLTLVCSVLFGEFKVRDYNERDEKEEEMQDQNLSKSSTAFSILCMFLTILYAGFAALVFSYSGELIKENEEDARREALQPSDYDGAEMEGYIGDKFTVNSAGVGNHVGGNTEHTGYIQTTQTSSFGQS
eukprot:CAMPEP_0197234310 /NCGR_PEP_ID=MMETSP1429-20130617/2079_1 /TAXON_ID=49237 /ORGANISM="Chaetoceros  sp., Strain UNC1202" /LENGTH=260 /DNA_ID=CAMNT_0042692681 /DNA_START=72 /DNA_END=854 /DNA_ORIENTATION=+